MRTLIYLLILSIATPVLAETTQHPIWGGFEYKWTKHPHRFSLVASRFEEGKHLMGVKIGACPPDTASYKVPYQMLSPTNGLVIKRGTIRLETRGSINKWQSATETENNLLSTDQNANAVVILNGFRVRSRQVDLSKTGRSCNLKGKAAVWALTMATGCKKKACSEWDSGWHFSGIDIGVSAIRGKDQSFGVKATVGIKPADSPDEVNGGDCRCHGVNWPTSIATAHKIEIDYMILTNSAGQLTAKGFVMADNIQRTTHWKLQKKLSVSGQPGFNSATAGLTRFAMDIGGGRYPEPGRYVREMGFRILGFDYKKKTGQAEIVTKAFFSNVSELPHWWVGKARVEGMLIQFKNTTPLKHHLLEGEVSKENQQRLPLAP